MMESKKTSGTLIELLRKLRHLKFIFVRPTGNQGDQLIYQGMEKIADQLKIKRMSVSVGPGQVTPPVARNQNIYLHGGGGFVPWWDWTPRLLSTLRVENPKNLIIVGPTTLGDPSYWKKFIPDDENTIFFCRERHSYSLLKANTKKLIPMLDHDTAFHLRLGDGYLERITGNLPVQSRYKLLAVREDKEQALLPKSIDVTKFDVITDPVERSYWWAKTHFDASEIVTNRSHSAILGWILGKPTTMFPNNYHKNKSIWEYSLKDKEVKWVE